MMRRTGLLTLLVALLASANPIVTTYINEAGFHGPAGGQWVELSVRPHGSEWAIGWRLRTSTSECTLNTGIASGSPLLIDSRVLVERELAWGTLQLRSDTDTISLFNEGGGLVDKVVYPRLPIGYQSAPRPPGTQGSISHWNEDGYTYGWYVDSTGSPGQPNDNYSTISGTISAPGESILGCRVIAEGRYGLSDAWTETRDYTVRGLGPGSYRVRAYAYTPDPETTLTGAYPDSVLVGYDEDVTGIDIIVGSAIAEPKAPPSARPRTPATLVRDLLFLPEGEAGGRAALFDLQGRTRARLRPGPNDISRLAPGVYFLKDEGGRLKDEPGSRPAVRKVIVQR